MDGCSPVCTREDGFQCDLPAPPADPLSDCTYTRPIDFKIHYLEKVPGANQVKA